MLYYYYFLFNYTFTLFVLQNSLKYLISLHKYTYHHIKREMGSFRIHLWENTMFVNSNPKSDGTGLQLNISLILCIKPMTKQRKLILCRQSDDTISTLIERIKLKLSADYVFKKLKISISNIAFQKDGIKICDKDTLKDVFENNKSIITLQLQDTIVNIVYNAPIINKLKLNNPVYENLMLYPYGLDYGYNVSVSHINYLWYRINPQQEEIEVGCEMTYTPTAEDVDCYLKVVCTPYNEEGQIGPTAEKSSSKVLKNAIETYPYENRLKERDYDKR